MTAQEHTITIDGAIIRYRDTGGDGAPIVFVHGVYVAGALWSSLVERLPGRRCIVPTWPHGAHADPAPNADLSARAAVRRILSFLEALDLHDVTLVGNDTGGGLCLAALGADDPAVQRIGRMVLTNCDSYEHFPPEGFAKLVNLNRKVPMLGRLMLRGLASKGGRRKFVSAVCVNPPADVDTIFEAFATSGATRKDAARMTASLEPSVTLDAAHAIPTFGKPVLIVWGGEDALFPVAHAERLAAEFACATLRVIPEAGTYVMLDRPDAVAAAVSDFLGGV